MKKKLKGNNAFSGKLKLITLLSCMIAVMSFALMPVFAAVPASQGAPVQPEAAKIDTSERLTLKIAMDTSWVPYCYYNEKSKSAEGIIPNILNTIAERENINVEYVPFGSYSEALEAVQDGSTDLVSGVAEDHDLAKAHQVSLTAPYLSISYCAVTKEKVSDLYKPGNNYKVAVCKGSYSNTAMKEQMPGYDFVEYTSNTECIDAVNDGDVEMALVASYASECYLSLSKYSKLHSVLINDYTWGLCFGVNKSVDSRLTDRLNEGISMMTAAETNQAIYNGMIGANNYYQGFRDFIFRNAVAVIISMLVVFAVIIVVILIIYNMRRKARMQVEAIERQSIEAMAENKAKTEFLARMSHDMRTPMNGILGLAALMKDRTDLVEINNDIVQLEISAHYLLELINDTLDISRIESGKLELHPEPVLFSHIAENLESNARMMSHEKGVTFILDTSKGKLEKPVAVYVDAGRIEQIFMNIISNAVKYSPINGHVRVAIKTVSMDDEYLIRRYKISDNGIGMSPEFLEHIFEPFSQEGRLNSERQNGTGLGMSIVEQLLALMDGTIDIKSEINEGTTIIIIMKFPIYHGDVEEEEKEVVDLSVLSGIRVLLCEDHPLNRRIAGELLRRQGMAVECAENGQIGVDMFDANDESYYDMVLMDIRMPVMDGLAATARIRELEKERKKRIPVIAMTANAFASDVQNCLDAGMDAHLSKPIEPDKMLETMAKYIALSKNKK